MTVFLELFVFVLVFGRLFLGFLGVLDLDVWLFYLLY